MVQPGSPGRCRLARWAMTAVIYEIKIAFLATWPVAIYASPYEFRIVMSNTHLRPETQPDLNPLVIGN
jgi:hypothetical protein